MVSAGHHYCPRGKWWARKGTPPATAVVRLLACVKASPSRPIPRQKIARGAPEATGGRQLPQPLPKAMSPTVVASIMERLIIVVAVVPLMFGAHMAIPRLRAMRNRYWYSCEGLNPEVMAYLRRRRYERVMGLQVETLY